MSKGNVFLSLLLIMVFIISVPALGAGEVPKTINYQGYLTDSNGNPVNDTISMTFAIYDVDTSGTPLWSETQNVNITNGVYSVTLGAISLITIPFDTQYWLGITVDTDTEMIPRQALTSVGQAIRADTAETALDIADSAVTDGKITGPISASKIQQGSGSTLDADTIDGMDATSFMNADTDNWVDISGDTMTGGLHLPANGFTVGTNQLVLAKGRVGIGTPSPSEKLSVTGTIESTSGGIKFPDGTVQTTTAKTQNIIVVDQSGSGFKTIQSAIESVTPSASNPYIIEVRPGTYIENIVMKSHIHLKGASMDATTIVPSAYNSTAITLTSLSGVKISGFTFRYSSNPEISGDFKGIHDSGSSPVIYDCRFTKNGNGGPGIHSLNSSPRIFRNEFINNDGEGIFFQTVSHASVSENLFDFNLGISIKMFDSYGNISRNTFLNCVTEHAIKIDGHHAGFESGYGWLNISDNYINGAILFTNSAPIIIKGNDIIDGHICVDNSEACIIGNRISGGPEAIFIDTGSKTGDLSAEIIGNIIRTNGIGILSQGSKGVQITGNNINAGGSYPGIHNKGSARIINNSLYGGSPGILDEGEAEIIGNYIAPHSGAVGIDNTLSLGTESHVFGNRIVQDTPDSVGHRIVTPSGIRLESSDESIMIIAGSSTISIQPTGEITIQGSSSVDISATGDLNLRGQNIDISAANELNVSAVNLLDMEGTSIYATGNLDLRGQNIDISAVNELDVSAGGLLDMQGTSINLWGSGITDIQGSLINLN